jgi:hypothetical protein
VETLADVPPTCGPGGTPTRLRLGLLSRAGQGAVATTRWCCRAVLARADHFGLLAAGVVLSFFFGDPSGEVSDARAPTIEPDSDKTSRRCRRIRPDPLTRKGAGLYVSVSGRLGTSHAVAVSRPVAVIAVAKLVEQESGKSRMPRRRGH